MRKIIRRYELSLLNINSKNVDPYHEKTPQPRTPTSGGRKCSAADDEDESISAKRPRIGCKPTTGHAIKEVASSVKDLASAFHASGGEPTPQRRARAVQQMERDDDLSDNEMNDAFQLMQTDVSIVDTYNAIGRKERRTRYIQSELERTT